jgi:hypothetical protein
LDHDGYVVPDDGKPHQHTQSKGDTASMKNKDGDDLEVAGCVCTPSDHWMEYMQQEVRKDCDCDCATCREF